MPSSLFPFATRHKRPALAVSASLLILGAIVFFVSARSPAQAKTVATPAQAAPKVTVASVEQRLLVEHTDLIGRVDAVETVEIRPRVSGHIAQVHFESGQLVRAGQLLFTIDPRYYQAAFNAARAAAEQARVRVSITEREARRADQLLAERAISTEEAETRQSRAEEARAGLLSAEAALAATQLDLDYTEIRSPIAGRVSRAFITTGNLISGAPGAGTVLTTVVSQEKAYVYANIDEATVLQFNRVAREGRLATDRGRIPVEMQLSDESGYPHRGHIESVDNHLDGATGSLLVRMVFDNTDGGLLPGLFARVRIPMSAPQQTLLISERAIGTDQSQKFVLAVSPDQTVAYRTVKLGPSIGGKRVVRTGLQPGEQIIVNGLQRVRPGMTVAPEFAAADAPTLPAVQLAVK
jgi:multidrug efflux system membrane fusion protein